MFKSVQDNQNHPVLNIQLLIAIEFKEDRYPLDWIG